MFVASEEKRKSKPLGTDLPTSVVDRFTKWAEEFKHVKAGAAAQAIEFLMRTPVHFRQLVMQGRWNVVDRFLDEIEIELIEQAKNAANQAREDEADAAVASSSPTRSDKRRLK